ncbi:unnamed protein product [Nezara viridula]|uniref:Uncharacterized protein n=1 Tax=Nezara viridula TaxID=85310 RepID=A0A9P0H6A6_NEZVI|nr:unnamed protein product [Nezara viridula]
MNALPLRLIISERPGTNVTENFEGKTRPWPLERELTGPKTRPQKCKLEDDEGGPLAADAVQTLQIHKKKRIVGKVFCRNIKHECPEPKCDEPVLSPGRCCKTCPGDGIGWDLRSRAGHSGPVRLYLPTSLSHPGRQPEAGLPGSSNPTAHLLFVCLPPVIKRTSLAGQDRTRWRPLSRVSGLCPRLT